MHFLHSKSSLSLFSTLSNLSIYIYLSFKSATILEISSNASKLFIISSCASVSLTFITENIIHCTICVNIMFLSVKDTQMLQNSLAIAFVIGSYSNIFVRYNSKRWLLFYWCNEMLVNDEVVIIDIRWYHQYHKRLILIYDLTLKISRKVD